MIKRCEGVVDDLYCLDFCATVTVLAKSGYYGDQLRLVDFD